MFNYAYAYITQNYSSKTVFCYKEDWLIAIGPLMSAIIVCFHPSVSLNNDQHQIVVEFEKIKCQFDKMLG